MRGSKKRITTKAAAAAAEATAPTAVRHKSAKNTLSQVISFNEHGFFFMRYSRKSLWFLRMLYDKPERESDE